MTPDEWNAKMREERVAGLLDLLDDPRVQEKIEQALIASAHRKLEKFRSGDAVVRCICGLHVGHLSVCAPEPEKG